MQAKAYRAARLVFFVLLAMILFALLSVKYGCAQTQVAPFSTNYAYIYQTLSANIDGEMFPAQCGATSKPTWCTGSTADAWIRAACSQLPSTGGVVNLRGLNGTIANSVTCSGPTKPVITLFDNSSLLTITESDGGTAFPQDDSSMALGPGAGQCYAGGVRLASTANIAAIVGPAHTDGSQENMTVSGLCVTGIAGATVTQGLLYGASLAANTTFENNNAFVCNTACLKIVNGGSYSVANNWFNVTDPVSGSPLILQGSGSSGCQLGTVNVSGGQFEHANGGGPEIQITGNGSGALVCSIKVHDVGIERGSGGTPSTIAIKIQDCIGCSVDNVLADGGAGGTDLVNISQTGTGRSQNISVEKIDNLLGTYVNTINDTTPTPSVPQPITFNAYPYIANYISNPGFTQPPVLPGTTIQSVSGDVMNGLGNFETGSSTFGTDFAATGCQSPVTCTFTRTNATAAVGTYSQEIQVGGSGGGGYNGVVYTPTVSYVAGQAYTASFWGKGDGTFTGLPTFLLSNFLGTTPCLSQSGQPFPTAWTLYSFVCVPTSSGSGVNLAVAANTPAGATGTFYVDDFIFAPVVPLTPGSLLTSITPYGIGPATTAQQTITINSVPCVLGGSCSAGGGVASVNTIAHPLVISYAAGAGSCSDSGTIQTCTFTGSSTGGGSVTNFIAGAWPSWITPSVATSTTTPTLSVTASAIPNSALANSSFTIGSTSVTLGATVTSFSGVTLSSPTLITPTLGTPTSVNLTNGTNLPWTGIAGSPSTAQVPFQSLSTTGTSGPATLVAGVLNIPQYATTGGSTSTICSGTLSLGTSAIASGAAASTVTATCTGLASTDDIMMDFNGSPLSTTGFIPSSNGMLTIIKWPTTNTINVSVVNNTAASVTPGAVVLNYRVVR